MVNTQIAFTDAPESDALESVIREASAALARRQAQDGHWVFELEADATIPAEYIMLEHYLDEIDDGLEARIAVYLRDKQGPDGGWPLFHDGAFDLSATVKAYYALKLVGDDPEAPHMKRARELVLAHGGAAEANVFTRIALALFGQVPWRAVPVMPLQIMLLPRWFPFHLSKVSYWSRTVIVPLLILMALKPRARNPRGIGIRELFVTPPEEERHYMRNATGRLPGALLLSVDRMLRPVERYLHRKGRLQARALRRALDFIDERLNGEDGLGGIFPAMANTVMAYDALGYGDDDRNMAIAKKAIRKLLVDGEERTYCQPCLSPVWDTALATHAMLEVEAGYGDRAPAVKAADWMLDRQILDVTGDWAEWAPDVPPGGWAFQYWNDYYPDVDDTAVVAMALDRIGDPRYRDAIDRAIEWIIGMQSDNGGWGAFDRNNTYHYLNHIPFADHGALLDPPTEDVSARCIGMLAQVGYSRDNPVMARGLRYLQETQQPDGSWYGRWGTNYIYGTWSVLSAFNAVGDAPDAPHVRKAVAWLESRQREDGGWGEDGATYWEEHRNACKASTPSQTAWALLALMAAGEVDSEAVRRGVDYLLAAPRDGAKWEEAHYTAVGFPRVFYLRYDGYSVFFPLWALARYRNLTRGNDTTVAYGI